MCKKTNKSLLCAGFGIQFLAYYCSTTFADIEVMNGGEKGGALQTIKDFDAKLLPRLFPNQVFLDNLTGDYYSYNKETNEWKP